MVISDQTVNLVPQYKYLGVLIDENFSFESQVCKRVLHCYLKLYSFNVSCVLMKMLDFGFIDSLLTFAFLCRNRSPSIKNKNHLQRIVAVCSKIASMSLNDLSDHYNSRFLKKANLTLANPSHSLWAKFSLLPLDRDT